MMKIVIGSAVSLCMLAGVAAAEDLATASAVSDFMTLSASLGHVSGKAYERVWYEDGTKASELVWDMRHALVLNGGLSVNMTEQFSAYGNVSVGLAADNYMDDYDWIGIPLGSPPPSEPNFHSWHDDTELDHYFTIDAGLAYALWTKDSSKLSLLGGFKYTDVKWTALGGCYDYVGVTGCIGDQEKVISYQLRLPAAYAGLGYAGSFDNWSLALEGRAGMTFAEPEAEDDHWQRSLHYLDHLNPEPYVSIIGKAAYGITETTSLFASAAYDQFFEMRGESTLTDVETGESERSDYDVNGASLYTLNLAVGVDMRF